MSVEDGMSRAMAAAEACPAAVAAGKRDGVDKATLMNDIIARVGPDGRILSADLMAHFEEIVPMMDLIEANRHGSRQETLSGRQCIFDVYELPNGTTILAGYPI